MVVERCFPAAMSRPTFYRILLTCFAALGYAVLRYLVFGEVEPAQVPVFILNKALAVASVVFLLYAGIDHRNGMAADSRRWGRASLHAAFAHVLLSLAILKPEYFPKFHDVHGRFNFDGGSVIAFGVAASWLFLLLTRNRVARLPVVRRRVIIASGLCLLGHLIPMGMAGNSWFATGEWPAGLPPMSLLSFAAVLAAMGFYLGRTRRRG